MSAEGVRCLSCNLNQCDRDRDHSDTDSHSHNLGDRNRASRPADA